MALWFKGVDWDNYIPYKYAMLSNCKAAWYLKYNIEKGIAIEVFCHKESEVWKYYCGKIDEKIKSGELISITEQEGEQAIKRYEAKSL